ncbi:MAG: hypothetical protein ACR2OB_13005 [Solirubrobacteraceae bacterium]
MSGLADTSLLVDYLRGVEPARDLLRTAFNQGQGVAGSVLTRALPLARRVDYV